jgi:hypothetical protein
MGNRYARRLPYKLAAAVKVLREYPNGLEIRALSSSALVSSSTIYNYINKRPDVFEYDGLVVKLAQDVTELDIHPKLNVTKGKVHINPWVKIYNTKRDLTESEKKLAIAIAKQLPDPEAATQVLMFLLDKLISNRPRKREDSNAGKEGSF